MKTSELGKHFQQLIGNSIAYDEVELGFDAMLSHDVVNFLTTDHNRKPLKRHSSFSQHAFFTLDEHELAMV